MSVSNHNLDRLERFLVSSACGEQALSVDQAHGFLTALACGPEPVPRAEWASLVFGGEPEFANAEEEREILGLLQALYDEIAESLADGEPFEPVYMEYDGEDADGEFILDADGWCQGFIRGMSFNSEQWMTSMEGELADLLYPIMALAADAEGMVAELDLVADDVMYQALLERIPENVEAIFQYWHPALPGPEDSAEDQGPECPCGSGLPFKRCCGGQRTLH